MFAPNLAFQLSPNTFWAVHILCIFRSPWLSKQCSFLLKALPSISSFHRPFASGLTSMISHLRSFPQSLFLPLHSIFFLFYIPFYHCRGYLYFDYPETWLHQFLFLQHLLWFFQWQFLYSYGFFWPHFTGLDGAPIYSQKFINQS